jgi:hypothetical protein
MIDQEQFEKELKARLDAQRLMKRLAEVIAKDPDHGGYAERKVIGRAILARAIDHSRGYDVAYPGWSTNVFDHFIY